MSAMFTIHKELMPGMWFHKSSDANKKDLDPKDFDIYLNPKVLGETTV